MQRFKIQFNQPLEAESQYCRQFVYDVAEFSSQYGREDAKSYTVGNLKSSPSIFPNYGDYLESCVLRTYGPWWLDLPSKIKFTSSLKDPLFISQDFIEVIFEKKLVIDSVTVYEIYHPGALVALYAFEYISQKWVRIWSIFDSNSNGHGSNAEARFRTQPAKISRKFRPELSIKSIYSDKLRLEFEHSRFEYYSELDAVEIGGETLTSIRVSQIASNLKSLASRVHRSISTKSSASSSTSDIDHNRHHPIKPPLPDILINRLEISDHRKSTSANNLADLPYDILIMILSQLDLKTIFSLRSTSKFFYNICSDEKFFRKLNLHPFWNLVDDNILDCLTHITSDIKMLNLSWTKFESIRAIESFFLTSCSQLTTLLLDCCSYVDEHVLDVISSNCSNLSHLSLSSCREIVSNGFETIKSLKNLTNLNLYRTKIDQKSIIGIVKSCHELKVLNLGSCVNINDFDSLMEEIHKQAIQLESLDMWRAYSLTNLGMNVLAATSCCLQEIDIGWCRNVKPFEWLETLTKNCKNLRKIFLTALRVNGREIELIAENCELLEQIDVLGSLSLSPESIEMVLSKCKNLKMFDISFCNNIDMEKYRSLCDTYKNCSIKKSFTNI